MSDQNRVIPPVLIGVGEGLLVWRRRLLVERHQVPVDGTTVDRGRRLTLGDTGSAAAR